MPYSPLDDEHYLPEDDFDSIAEIPEKLDAVIRGIFCAVSSRPNRKSI